MITSNDMSQVREAIKANGELLQRIEWTLADSESGSIAESLRSIANSLEVLTKDIKLKHDLAAAYGEVK